MTYTMFYENPKDNRIVKIPFVDIEEIARKSGDVRDPHDMDDDSFFGYCDLIVAIKSGTV